MRWLNECGVRSSDRAPCPSAVPPQSRTPLSGGDIQPPDSLRIMANTSLETYVQNKLSCMDCHQGAPIAQGSSAALMADGHPARRIVDLRPRANPAAGLEAAAARYASDYSFVFVAETNH